MIMFSSTFGLGISRVILRRSSILFLAFFGFLVTIAALAIFSKSYRRDVNSSIVILDEEFPEKCYPVRFSIPRPFDSDANVRIVGRSCTCLRTFINDAEIASHETHNVKSNQTSTLSIEVCPSFLEGISSDFVSLEFSSRGKTTYTKTYRSNLQFMRPQKIVPASINVQLGRSDDRYSVEVFLRTKAVESELRLHIDCPSDYVSLDGAPVLIRRTMLDNETKEDVWSLALYSSVTSSISVPSSRNVLATQVHIEAIDDKDNVRHRAQLPIYFTNSRGLFFPRVVNISNIAGRSVSRFSVRALDMASFDIWKIDSSLDDLVVRCIDTDEPHVKWIELIAEKLSESTAIIRLHTTHPIDEFIEMQVQMAAD